jgi:trehalose 6-phosphate phosphatase
MKTIDPRKCALFLDIDGTVLDIAASPGRVIVPPYLIDLLENVQDVFGGALAIVTGRSISAADTLLKPLRLPASGVHGCELRTMDGTVTSLCASNVSDVMMPNLENLVQSHPGLLVERKGAGIAVHYRAQPSLADELKAKLKALLAASPFPAQLIAGRYVYEILPAGRSKATGVQALLKTRPFIDRRPIMVGDDRGDIPAFDLVTQYGGVALKVGGEHFSAEGSHFEDPAAVRRWLDLIVRQSAANRELVAASKSPSAQ